MSKLERQVAVKFRRKHAIRGNSIKITAVPTEVSFLDNELGDIHRAIASGEQFYVRDGDETGVLIQLPNVHDLSWLPASCVERTL